MQFKFRCGLNSLTKFPVDNSGSISAGGSMANSGSIAAGGSTANSSDSCHGDIPAVIVRNH